VKSHAARATHLGELPIWRALPVRERRLIGPWCFLDRYGPLNFSEGTPMDVAPHPHIGIQTVSWLLAGEVLHQDSLGIEATVRPRGVNVMTSGRGIAHAETTPRANSGRLDGVQLWIALPDAYRDVAPAFDHVPEVPRLELNGAVADVIIGGASPATRYSELVGLDVEIHRGESVDLPLDPTFEHGFFLLRGDAHEITPNAMHYLEPGASLVTLRSRDGGRVLVIGGPPFDERIVMWWNFVARTPDEIRAAADDWARGERFGAVAGHPGPRIPAPSLGRLAAPNPAS
jgi:quercetin 2,3-dioxygenase